MPDRFCFGGDPVSSYTSSEQTHSSRARRDEPEGARAGRAGEYNGVDFVKHLL